MQMDAIRIPKYAVKVLQRLEDAGFKAYAVGGCVRDMLLGRRVNDYDVCTSARPDDIISLFPRSIPTGIKHGTVTVRSEGRLLEVTTFRTDGDYTDSRRPDSVHFLDTIKGDLSRRDFTINAMAADIRGNIIDPFKGVEDLKKKIIRCVGEPEKRFSEDALRMLRAMRFSAQLAFSIEDETYSSIARLASNVQKLSAERVRDEIQKILLSPCPEMLSSLIDIGLIDNYINDRKALDLSKINCLKKSPDIRWSAASSEMIKTGCIIDPEKFLQKLKLDRKTVKNAAYGANTAAKMNICSPVEWKRIVSQNGMEAAICAASSMDILYKSGHVKMLAEVLSSGECMTLSELAVNGNDIASIGITGSNIGLTLSRLLEHVIVFPADNRREKLLELVSQSAQF